MKIIAGTKETKKAIDKKVAIVVSEFHGEITRELVRSALAEFEKVDFNHDLITVVHVPGAVEIPQVAKKLASSKKYSAIICFGAIIKGETAHFDYVCEFCYRACNQLILDYDAYIIMGVITVYNYEQALLKTKNDGNNVGVSCATAAMDMMTIDDKLQFELKEE